MTNGHRMQEKVNSLLKSLSKREWGKTFFALDSCRVFICRSMNRLVRRCDFATMSQRKRRGHPPRVLWRTHTGLHVHYPQVPSPSSGGLDTRLFPLTCRLIIEIAAARADNSTRAAPSFNVPIDYQAISIPNTKSKDIKQRMCKFQPACTSFLLP